MRFAICHLIVLMSGPCLVSANAASSYRVIVPAAKGDRAGQVVTLAVPTELASGATLKDAAGRDVAVQIDSDRTARFIVPGQKSGEVARFTLTRGTVPLPGAGVQVVEEASPPPPGTAAVSTKAPDVARLGQKPGRLRLSVAGAPAIYYQMDKDALPRADIDPKYKRAGYLYPVLTPSGRNVTDDYPAQHIHHHSIWSPWTKTKFQGRTPDFWNMGDKTATVEFAGLDRSWGGPVHGGFAAWHRFVDLSAPTPVVALNETWQVTVYNVAPAEGLTDAAVPVRMFDLVITQTCATDDPLILPEYHYGGLGLRGRGEWFGAKKAFFLTSEGETDRVKANTSRARWSHLGGDIDGALAGTAVLGHPENFRAPQPLRIHPVEPYLCFAPSQLGEWSINPGVPYVARYRFIVADGPPNRALLDAYWNAYAHPAEAKVEAQE